MSHIGIVEMKNLLLIISLKNFEHVLPHMDNKCTIISQSLGDPLLNDYLMNDQLDMLDKTTTTVFLIFIASN